MAAARGTLNAEELKHVVMHTLETNGALGQLLAQLRANVCKAMDGKEEGPMLKTVSPVRLMYRLVTEIVAEFLTFHGFKHSLYVFGPESNLGGDLRSRTMIALEVGLPPMPADVSILEQLVSIVMGSSCHSCGRWHSSTNSTTASSPPPQSDSVAPTLTGTKRDETTPGFSEGSCDEGPWDLAPSAGIFQMEVSSDPEVHAPCRNDPMPEGEQDARIKDKILHLNPCKPNILSQHGATPEEEPIGVEPAQPPPLREALAQSDEREAGLPQRPSKPNIPSRHREEPIGVEPAQPPPLREALAQSDEREAGLPQRPSKPNILSQHRATLEEEIIGVEPAQPPPLREELAQNDKREAGLSQRPSRPNILSQHRATLDEGPIGVEPAQPPRLSEASAQRDEREARFPQRRRLSPPRPKFHAWPACDPAHATADPTSATGPTRKASAKLGRILAWGPSDTFQGPAASGRPRVPAPALDRGSQHALFRSGAPPGERAAATRRSISTGATRVSMSVSDGDSSSSAELEFPGGEHGPQHRFGRSTPDAAGGSSSSGSASGDGGPNDVHVRAASAAAARNPTVGCPCSCASSAAPAPPRAAPQGAGGHTAVRALPLPGTASLRPNAPGR